MSKTQLHKVLTHPKEGQRLGTTSATWNKIKQATGETHPKKSSSQVPEDSKSPNTPSPPVPYLVENGPNGELCIWYEEQSAYEIWGWADIVSYSCHRENSVSSYDFIKAETSDSETNRGDTLSLLSRFVAYGRSVKAMTFMSSADGPIFISVYSYSEKIYLEARAGSEVQEYEVPEYLHEGDISLKASSDYIVISSSKGLLYVLKYSPNTEESLFLDANHDGSLLSVYNHSTRTLVDKYKLQNTSDATVLLKTGIMDGSPIYDIVGTWLVYCPKRSETEYFKHLLHSGDDSFPKSSASTAAGGDKLYTSVKVPPSGPILMRAASSLANTAIDNIFKLSQMGTKKIKTYWNPEKNLFDKDVSLHTISSSIGKALYSTASKIKKQAGSIGENEIVKIIDLSNGQILATFKPPGGVSHLSLSGYDLQLAQATYRGDSVFIWDLYKLPKEVSFVGKFLRGKTSAIIKEIVWFVNNKTVNGSQVTNSGFGCITKKTGSIHWYNINYLFCANENDNHPNTMDISAQTAPKHGQFLDSWILPSINASKLLRLPGYSNMPNGISDEILSTDSSTASSLHRCNQLAFLDSSFNLRLVSPLNGKHTFKYKLNDKSSENIHSKEGSTYSTWHPFPEKHGHPALTQRNLETPLSQTEIETCAPFTSVTKTRNMAISSYTSETKENERSFWEHYSTFGNEIPIVVHEFGVATDSETPLTSTDDLTEYLNECLLTNSESAEENLIVHDDAEGY